MSQAKIGLARMHKEAGERRDFLPEMVHRLSQLGAAVVLERGYGQAMGYSEADYQQGSVRFAEQEEVCQQDYVLVLRYPSDAELALMHPGACLISMVHLPTRPGRMAQLRDLGLEAISLDGVKDDNGRRLVENLRAVGWNGAEIAFQALQRQYPHFESPDRPPIQVTLLGSGAVGSHAMQAAIRYGDMAVWQRMAQAGVPGVQVTVVDYDVTRVGAVMGNILKRTDLLIDATQRPDTSQVVIPNAWIAYLPQHAVLLDLSVDPYDCSQSPPATKSIEGVPQGNLDQYLFEPDDPAFDALPACVETKQRRSSASCYSWPGIHPRECMDVYGKQIYPLLRVLIEVGGPRQIDAQGTFFQRAMARAQLSRWA